MEVTEIVKKKEVESRDPHIKEAYLAEAKKRYITPASAPLLPTPIPNQPIAPMPILTPSPIEKHSSRKKELLIIKGINEKTAKKLEKLCIKNIDDLAKASAQNIAESLKVDLETAQEWVSKAKRLQ
jgi:predicted flap endonuclease-1-like 5' DNA nuclease